MYEELIQRAKALDEKATPGPWMWDMRTAHHTCQLVTAHSGQYYVMQFSRWGMQDACPEFQRFKRYSGPVTERGGLGMVRADKMAKSYPGKEHHKGFDDYIDHPDAVFIAASRALVTELIEAVTALQAENAELRKQRPVQVDGDVMALTLELAETKAALSRVEAERDAAVGENEFRKHTVLTPLYTCGGHGYGDDDDEDFWCPVCRQHLGTHRGFETTCPRCGQEINSDGEPCWDYDELRRTEYDHLPKNWERGAQGGK